jgi:hypothetical protein
MDMLPRLTDDIMERIEAIMGNKPAPIVITQLDQAKR